MSDNRRKFTRGNYRIFAEMEYAGEKIGGKVTDLSIKGLFVQMDEQVALGEALEVTLRMPFSIPPLEFRFRASVVRHAPGGIGLEIVESDLQAFTHLRNIVALQVGDSDQVLEELLPKK